MNHTKIPGFAKSGIFFASDFNFNNPSEGNFIITYNQSLYRKSEAEK